VKAGLSVCAFAGTVIAANWATATFGVVPLGVLGLSVTAGTFAAGAALVARDTVDEAGGRLAVAVAVGAGCLLSLLLAPAAIAVASAAAFTVAELVDWAVYRWGRRRRGRPFGVVASSVVAAPLDTIVFLSLAGFPVAGSTVAGQWLVKVGLAIASAVVIAWREGRRAVSVRV
jgi:hypothetical protein